MNLVINAKVVYYIALKIYKIASDACEIEYSFYCAI